MKKMSQNLVTCLLVVFWLTSLSWAGLTPEGSQDLPDQIDLDWGITELINNGGFEDGAWSNMGVSTAYKNSGAQSGTLTGSLNSSVTLTELDPTGTYTFSGYGARDSSAGGSPRVIINNYDDPNADICTHFFYAWTHEGVFESWTTDFTVGTSYSSARLWLFNYNGIGYFDDLSLRPKNLYVYRSENTFANTGDTGVQLIATLNGTEEGYQDIGVVGTYWYAVTATLSPIDVTAVEGSASMPGDINNDDVVNMLDLVILADNWLRTIE